MSKILFPIANIIIIITIIIIINSYNFSLSKYLVKLLSPMCRSEYSVKDSFTFANEIQNFSNHNYVIASIDIVSLFTSIPVDETYEVITGKVFKGVDEFEGLRKKTVLESL